MACMNIWWYLKLDLNKAVNTLNKSWTVTRWRKSLEKDEMSFQKSRSSLWESFTVYLQSKAYEQRFLGDLITSDDEYIKTVDLLHHLKIPMLASLTGSGLKGFVHGLFCVLVRWHFNNCALGKMTQLKAVLFLIRSGSAKSFPVSPQKRAVC